MSQHEDYLGLPAAPAASARDFPARTPRRAAPALRWHLPTWIVLAALLLLWQLLSQRTPAYTLPAPGKVLNGLVELAFSGDLWFNATATFIRISVGFLIAVLIALVVGFGASRWAVSRQIAHDVTAALNATSVFVWITLAIVWFGLSPVGPVFTTCLIVLPVMCSTLLAGIDAQERDLLDVARLYSHSELDRFWQVTLPLTLPYVVAGMQISFSLALRVSVVAEIFGVRSGVGYMMNFSRDTLRTDQVLVWAAVLIGMMLVVDKLVFGSILRRIDSWR